MKFVSNQRNFISNFIDFIILRRFTIIDNDKIKINKFNIYDKIRNNLND